MFHSAQIRPVLYPENFLCDKIERESDLEFYKVAPACLLKYFPKYYKNLSLSRQGLIKPVQTRIKKLKILKHFYGYQILSDDERIYKELFKPNRKTFKSIPINGGFEYDQNLSLCMYFPKVKEINLEKPYRFAYFWARQLEKKFTKLAQKKIKRAYGYFWSGSRFVESLKIGCCRDSDLIIIKKLDGSKRFLATLKTLEFSLKVDLEGDSLRNLVMELIANKTFLRHVTHLKIGDFNEKTLDWNLLQLLINCCSGIGFLSFSTGDRYMKGEPLNRDFCLDLRGLEKLQVLKINVHHFRTFMNGIDFPRSIRKISLKLIDYEDSDSLKELFHDNEDKGDLVLSNFFEKWRKLENLRALDLHFQIFSEVDILLKNFILPLLRAVLKLETFNCFFLSRNKKILQAYRMSFDLEAFLNGIEPLQSLKTIKIDADKHYNCVFSGSSQKFFCFPNLSSMELDIKIQSGFDFENFFKVVLGSDNPEIKHSVIAKTIKFPRIYFFGVGDFLRFLDSTHLVSHFENIIQAHFQINLIVENFDNLYDSLKSPIKVAGNVQLTVVDIYLKDYQAEKFTNEQEQFFQRVFGRLQFSVKRAKKPEMDIFYKGNCQKVLL